MTRVAFICSEIFPYVKTGGLADVAGSLPAALVEQGIEVFTITPLYAQVDSCGFEAVSELDFTLEIPAGKFPFQVMVTESKGVKHYFLKQQMLYERKSIYGNYHDNGLRFGLFSLAALKLAHELKADQLHLHEWHSALIAYLAHQEHETLPALLTIHNFAYQGIFDASVLYNLGIPMDDYVGGLLEFNGSVNFLKAGICCADSVNTVSAEYLGEIKRAEFSFGLETIVRECSHKFHAIRNALDDSEWNPGTDIHLQHHFDRDNIQEGKRANKEALLVSLGLEHPEYPLYIFIARLTEQKGVEFILSLRDFMTDLDANLLIIGEGGESYKERLLSMNRNHQNVHVHIGYQEDLSRKAYAAADFLLMPSVFEPCGLNQLIAMRYGTLPIVHSTGGLHDTVSDYAQSEAVGKGQGIVFEHLELTEFLRAWMRSLALFANQERMNTLIKNNMALDFSWKDSAVQYRKLYDQKFNKGGCNGF